MLELEKIVFDYYERPTRFFVLDTCIGNKEFVTLWVEFLTEQYKINFERTRDGSAIIFSLGFSCSIYGRDDITMHRTVLQFNPDSMQKHQIKQLKNVIGDLEFDWEMSEWLA